MAEFTAEFERNINPGPEYDNYSIDQATQCNDDVQQRNVMFNDIINGDFVVGFNYNSSTGTPPQSLRILSYTDEMFWTETSSGIVTPVPGFVPSELKENSTGNVLTYPFTININNLNNIDIQSNSLELECNDSAKYVSRRNRVIEYIIFDQNGQAGPIRKATFTNIQQ